jgi:uncharacterized NAD(P)/FAD-binding protein YdhS/quercetin dioxygenase-like cupin family protein
VAATQPQLTPALAALRDHLLGIARPDGAAMAAALAAAPITFDDVRGFVRFDDESYVRALICSNDRLELRLHCWRPGQSSSLHGHGASACAFKILRGTATETVLGDRDRVWAPGSVVVENAPRLHQVMNAGRDPLLTLHAYSPPLPVDAPSSRRGRQVVIVGGGFAGAAVAYHLLREMEGDGRIHLVEMGPWLGRGIAYGVESEVFRLNVPASRMSLDPETPDDFVTFSGSEAAPHAFLGRALYARYVTARFGACVKTSKAKLRLWRDEAVAVTRDAVVLRSGATLPAEAVVLATGIVPRVKHAHALWHPRVIDAWDECALATLPKQGRLLLLGSGLSALDVLAFLDAQGFAGEVTLVSPRGLLPLPHEPEFQGTTPLPAADVERAPKTVGPLVRWVRRTIAAAVAGGLPWQRAIDRLRPHVVSLYRALPAADRASFVRHVRPYWDVFRHRAPADALVRVDEWARAGRLRRLAGRVTIDGREDASSVTVAINERSGQARRERFDAVVRCVGPALDAAEATTPLLQSLIAGGLAALAPNGLGIETTPDGRIIDGTGEASSRIFGLGAVRRACDWETTSVPDIAKHAQQLARAIARR